MQRLTPAVLFVVLRVLPLRKWLDESALAAVVVVPQSASQLRHYLMSLLTSLELKLKSAKH